MRRTKIYSLSTVGVLKHFNQDYLFHEERTDFTGRNGVGKSIIADLLQIIFVGDKKLIKFGTGGINPDMRTIHSLPYKQNEAYAFLNIEIEDGNFIVVGVCISSNSGIPLKPFLILKTPNINDDIENNYFNKPLSFKNFTEDSGRILPLKKLAGQILNKEKLYLKYFTYSEDLGKYYSFLFNKEILSINLGISDNLKAFSTVIQSFSRANTLKLSSSKSLKSFLFETSNEEYIKEYRKLEFDLSELMVGYNRLDSKISDIKKKQLELTTLKQLDDRKKEAELFFDKCDFSAKWNSLELSNKNYQKKKIEFETNTNELKISKKRVLKIQKLLIFSKKEKDLIDGKMIVLNELTPLVKKLSPIEKKIKEVQDVNFPKISPDDKNILSKSTEFSEINFEEVKTSIPSAKKLIEKYGSISNLNLAYDFQQELIQKRRNDLTNLLDYSKKLLEVLSSTSSDSLLHKVLTEDTQLTIEQEKVLLALIDVKTSKPLSPKTNDRFAISTAVINTRNLELDKKNNGVWLKMGEVKEFFEIKNKSRLLADPKAFSKSIGTKISEIKLEIETLNKKLIDITDIEKGVSCKDDTLINKIDLTISNYSSIENTKKVIGLILRKDDYIKSLQSSVKKMLERKQELIEKININIDEALEDFNAQLHTKRIHYEKRIEKINNLLTDEEKLHSSFETKESFLKNNQGTAKITLNDCETVFNSVKSKFQEKYNNNEFDFLNLSFIEKNNVDANKEIFNKCTEEYITKYISTADNFEETKSNKDISISLQISSRAFNFKALEQTLLGNKINYLDNITPKLQEMNTDRFGFVNDIYEKMIKIFSKTREQYERFDFIIKDLNTFFKDKKISDEYYFNLVFKPNNTINIDWIFELQEKAQNVFLSDEFQMGESVESFIENFFKKTTRFLGQIKLTELLNPKTYFELSVKLVNENNIEIPGSTGETYSAIVLLGIARLSKVQSEKRNGVKFIILEESSNLDNANFNTFPKIAKEYGYQIITMTPKPYGADTSDGWYLHHLIKGKDDSNINYPVPASYFKTKNTRKSLDQYLIKESE